MLIRPKRISHCQTEFNQRWRTLFDIELPLSTTLRILDRFIVNNDGKIVGQSNYFDPRSVTNPGDVSKMRREISHR